MQIRFARVPSSLALFLGLAVVIAPTQGCGSSVDGVCDAICDCTGCSDSEFEDCVDDGEDAEKAADEAGCADQFGEYMDCLEDELECSEDAIQADGCDSEEKALVECGGTSFGNPCERAIQHAEECGFDVTGGEEVECTGDVACSATCFVNAPCTAFTGEDQAAADAYLACASACGSTGTGGSTGSGDPPPPPPDQPAPEPGTP